jgi:hypothetical protein
MYAYIYIFISNYLIRQDFLTRHVIYLVASRQKCSFYMCLYLNYVAVSKRWVAQVSKNDSQKLPGELFLADQP